MNRMAAVLKARQRLGKYRIEERIAEGGFATVYRAYDTIEGIRVALKIPHPHLVTAGLLDQFRAEARLTAQLDHPNILVVKNAAFIDDQFVIASPLGTGTLGDRLQRRMSLKTAVGFIDQMLAGLAHAHGSGVIHCDIKPENFILFPDQRLRLSDFGVAKLALRTIQASGSGTVGYMAPEQAMGRPSPRSDVFSAGLVIYRMLSGALPEWPFEWPPPGYDRLRRAHHPDLLAFLQRSIELDERLRFAGAGQMQTAFDKIRPRVLAHGTRRARRSKDKSADSKRNWKTVRMSQFMRDHGRPLGTKHECARCGLPVSERMRACPWCGTQRERHRGEVAFPAACPRCGRGVKLDWQFCPWCWGPGIGPAGTREYSDVRYDGRCRNPNCSRRDLMPFMHYCPWCHWKVGRKWSLEGSKQRCPKCGWGVLSEYWEHCPWCAASLRG